MKPSVPPILYDSVWALGDACATQLFIHSYFSPQPYSPFAWLTFWSLTDAVNSFFSGFRDLLRPENIQVVRGMTINTEQSVFLTHLFRSNGEDGGSTRDVYMTSSFQVLEHLDSAKETLTRREKRFREALEDKNAYPLLIWFGVPKTGLPWDTLFEYQKKGKPRSEYNEGEAKEVLALFRQHFPANISLLYIAYDPECTGVKVRNAEENFLGLSHGYSAHTYIRNKAKKMGEILARDLKYLSPALYHTYKGKLRSSTPFRIHMAKKIIPSVLGRVRAYIFLRQGKDDRYSGGTLTLRFIPSFVWTIFYLQSEGVEDIVIVSAYEQVRAIAEGFGYRVLTDEEYGAEWKGDLEYEVRMDGDYPFHQPGKLREILLALTSGVKYACTTNNEMVGVNHTIVTGEAQSYFSDLSYPYTLKVEDVRSHKAAWYMAYNPNGRELLPHSIQTVAVIQNQHAADRDYSAFIDGCDLIFRVNVMDSVITGCYGKRCDGLFCGDWSRFVQVKPMRKAITDHLSPIPLVYSTNGNILKNGDYPYGEPINEVWKQTNNAWWTTSALACHIAHRAFPEAKVYTTHVETLLTFNTRFLDSDNGTANEPYIWEYWADKGEVVDMCKDETIPSSPTPEYVSTIIIIREGKEEEVVINRELGLCLLSRDQCAGEITFYNGEEVLKVKWVGALWTDETATYHYRGRDDEKGRRIYEE